MLMSLTMSACASGVEAEPVTTTTRPVTTTIVTTSEAVVEASPEDARTPCAAPDYFPSVLPERVADVQPDPADASFDPFLLIANTSNRFLADDVGDPVVAVVRGTLPPEQWATKPSEIQILDDIPAALGPLSDGVWAVAWVFSETDPCDQYTMFLYPPTSAEEARAAAESL